MNALRTAFLSLHIAGGVIGLVLGAYVLRPPLTSRFRLWVRSAYTFAVVVLSAFLVALVMIDWTELDATTRIVFAALVGLAILIVTRALLAFRQAQRQTGDWHATYMKHIFFTYISLWEGFFIVGLLDLGAPGWLVGAVAVGVLLLGSVWFTRWRGDLVGRPALE